MFRSFLSWRYLTSRASNLIAIVGILLAVGALILIRAIMTGFLEEQRGSLRGTLSDVVVRPYQGATPGVSLQRPRHPQPYLEVIAEDPRVVGTAAQLQWHAIIKQPGTDYSRLFSSSAGSELLFVRLVGIDVHSQLRLALPLVSAAVATLGGAAVLPEVHDELGASAFLESLVGPPGTRGPWTFAPEVPLFPFHPPASADPVGLPKEACLLGEKLAFQLDIRRGDTIQLVTLAFESEDDQPKFNNREFVVSGTFKTEENETDLERIYVAREVLGDFLASERPYTQILVRVDDFERHGHAVRDDLEARLIEERLILGSTFLDGEVRVWEDFHENLLRAIENERVLMGFMLFLVLLVACFTVFATLSMMVTEKRRDIGVLTALGATPTSILQLFLMMAFWDALVGSLIGGSLGVLLAVKIDAIEQWLSATFGWQIFDRNVYLFSRIPTVIEPEIVAGWVATAFVCAHLFAAIPAWRASRMDPIAALRYE